LNWLLQLLGCQSLLICYKLRTLSSEVPYLVAGIAYTCSVGDELFGFEWPKCVFLDCPRPEITFIRPRVLVLVSINRLILWAILHYVAILLAFEAYAHYWLHARALARYHQDPIRIYGALSLMMSLV
jgi:hypothetical protein